MDMDNETQLLHEMPILRAAYTRLRCLLKGGHRHVYIGRTYLGITSANERHYTLHYICKHCAHMRCFDEFEKPYSVPVDDVEANARAAAEAWEDE